MHPTNSGDTPQSQEREMIEMQGKHIDLLHMLTVLENCARDARSNLVLAMENGKAAQRMGSVELADPSATLHIASAAGREGMGMNLGGPTQRERILKDCEARTRLADQLIAQACQAATRAAELRKG